MGGGSSTANKKNQIKNTVEINWETIQSGQDFNVVRNKSDGREGQQFQYDLDNIHDPSGEALIFSRRSKAVEPIIRVWQHQFQSKGKGFIPINKFRVITQRISHKLNHAPQLTFDESLYIFDRALEGYQFLYQQVGPFDINSNMIGFTPEGQAKVWFNENFGINYPAHEKRILKSTRVDETHKYNAELSSVQEIEMVRNIVNVVEDKCQEGRFPGEFGNRIRDLIGFNSARRLVSQQLSSSDRVRLNRVDLMKNTIKSKVTNTVNSVDKNSVEVLTVNSAYQPVKSVVNKRISFNYQPRQAVANLAYN